MSHEWPSSLVVATTDGDHKIRAEEEELGGTKRREEKGRGGRGWSRE